MLCVSGSLTHSWPHFLQLCPGSLTEVLTRSRKAEEPHEGGWWFAREVSPSASRDVGLPPCCEVRGKGELDVGTVSKQTACC